MSEPEAKIHNVRKRKFPCNNNEQQPSFKKQKKAREKLTISTNKGEKCIFCEERIGGDKLIMLLLTSYCCNIKICPNCISLQHNKPCPNCEEIVYAHKYWNTMDDTLTKLEAK